MKTSLPCLCPAAPIALRRHFTWAALALGLTGLLGLTARADFALPFYEPFPASYTNGGTTITVNGVTWNGRALYDTAAPQFTVWSWGANGTGNPTNCGGAALSYPGLWQAPGSVGLFMQAIHVTGGRNAGITLTPINSGKVYASFLINVQSWPVNTNRMVCQLSDAPAAMSGSDLIGFCLSGTNTAAGTSNMVYVTKHGSYSTVTNPPPNAPVISAGTTHLIVMRYTFNHTSSPSTNLDTVDMWCDPPSLGVAEGSVPAPAFTIINGIDCTNFVTFAMCAQNDTTIAGASYFFDELRLGRTWADVTPTQPPCVTVGIVSNPTNTSVIEGGVATFNVVASGTSPAYQWQVSTDGGATWNPATAPTGFSTNTASYAIPSVTMAQNGYKYRCQASVSCDNSVAYSTAATLTVTPQTATPVGVLVDDFFASQDRLNGPVNSTNSQWFTDTSSSLNNNLDIPPLLVGQPVDGSSCVWLGYFVGASNPPVHLDIGTALRARLVYTCKGIASGTNSGLRMGLFDLADAGIRLTGDGSAVKNPGPGIRGYMFYQNWDTVFSDDQPQTLYARNNLGDTSLMGTTADYATLAHAASGFSNAPAFSSGTTYTMDLYVARMTQDKCSVYMNVSGGGTNYSTAAADSNYGYHRFDCIAWRPNNLQTTASEFDFSEFKTEVLQIPPAPRLNVALSGANVVLSWTNPAPYAPFRLQHSDGVMGTYTVPAGWTNPYIVPATNSTYFFRLVWP